MSMQVPCTHSGWQGISDHDTPFGTAQANVAAAALVCQSQGGPVRALAVTIEWMNVSVSTTNLKALTLTAMALVQGPNFPLARMPLRIEPYNPTRTQDALNVIASLAVQIWPAAAKFQPGRARQALHRIESRANNGCEPIVSAHAIARLVGGN